MFKSKTVFVIGAGASDEAGLPIGRKLTSEIAQLVDIRADFGRVEQGDYQIFETLQKIVNKDPERWNNNTLLASGRHIAEAMEMATSIDTFLESFADDDERKTLGKLGIAKAIISAERSSKFRPDGHEPFKLRQVADTWYVSLAQLLFSAVPAKSPEHAFENVSFVVFNYDRCVQVFLARALQVYFQIGEAHSRDILRKVRFLHPYGNLGSPFAGDTPHVPYAPSSYDLQNIAENINTFSESVKDTAILEEIRTEVRQAETLVFLGFAFHDQNMKILSAPKPRADEPATRRVLATTFDMSKSDTEIVRSLIGDLISGQPLSVLTPYEVSTFNGKCAAFFAEYWRSLTAS